MESSNLPESLDIDKLRQWIGREQESQDIITPRLIAQWNACFDDPGASVDTASKARSFPGLHWAIAPDTAPLASLDADGHVTRGRFLPPVPLPDRMWAGGQLEHMDPLRPGDVVWRRSRVEDITAKQGRSGRLCFVSVRHDFSTDRGIALSERQDIVYRDLAAESGRQADAGIAAPQPAAPMASWKLNTGPVRLFRYSAVTFNGHLIHYDRDYCRGQGYPGLLVHGPLQATLLLRLATALRDGALPRRFSYRARQPLFEGLEFSVNAAQGPDGLDLWTAAGTGPVTMNAQASW